MDPKEEPDFNIEEAADSIGADLFNEGEPIENESEEAAPINTAIVTPGTPVVEPKAPPKAWPKEMHEKWGTLAPEVQQYLEKREEQMMVGLEQYKGDAGLGKSIRDVVTPYKPIIESAGLDEAKAIGYLLNAHYRLTQGSPQQRMAEYRKLGESMGFIQPGGQPQMDPALRPFYDKIQTLESRLQQQDQRAYQEVSQKTGKLVNDFASEKDADGNLKHPYFDEVSADTVTFINAGLNLEDAYRKAVYANDVTREKEFARLQKEQEKNLREKSKVEAEAARKAAGGNVRGRDTKRSPTEALGTMEDTMKETLAAIRSRTH